MDSTDENAITVEAASESPSSSRNSVANPPYIGNKWTPLLALCSVTGFFGFGVPAGYNLGVMNTPTKILQHWCNVTLSNERGVLLTEHQFDILWSFIISSFLIGGVIGGLTGAWFTEKIGRKGAIVIGNTLNLISGVMFFSSKSLRSVEVFFCARVIVGYVAGLMTTVMPMYLSEISPPKLKGQMGMIYPLGFTFGILFSQIIGLNWILGTEALWHWLLSLYGLISVGVYVVIPWIPESPKYLFQVKREENKALSELARLRNLAESVVSWELTSNKSVIYDNEIKWNLVRVLREQSLHIPLLLVVALQAGQQLSGINVIFYYSSKIFENAGVHEDSIPYANIGTGVVNFGMVTSTSLVVNRYGRRPLIMMSCLLITTTLILITYSIRFMAAAPWVPYMSVFFVLCFVLVFDLGLGPIPYFIGAELVETGPRPIIMALGSVANWGTNFLVAVTYTLLNRYLHEYSFLVFALCTVLLMLFIKLYLPETNPSALEDTSDQEVLEINED